MPCWQQDSLLLAGPQVCHRMHSTVMFIIELHALQCLFVSGLIKNKGGLFQISQKERLFPLLYQASALGDDLTMWSLFLHPSKKAFLSPSVWASREYIWKLSSKESLLICFENYQGVPCSQRYNRNRMMNTFIIVNITPICKRKFRG